MPAKGTKTVKEIIFWQYAKIVAESAGFKKNYGMIMSRYKKFLSDEITWSSSVREWVLEREITNICIYCGVEKKLTTDHLLARSCDGEDIIDNVINVCQSCNSSKGNKGLYEWRGLEAKDEHHRIAEGKYLKYLYKLHERNNTLDVDIAEEICPICNLKNKCIEDNSEGKLKVYCIEGCFLKK